MKVLERVTIALFVLALVVYIGSTLYYDNMVDRTPPVLSCDDTPLEVSVRDPESALLVGVTATDDRDGDLTDRIQIRGISQLLTADTAKVSYIVFDSSDNMATCTRYIRYTDYEKPRFSLTPPLVFAVGELVDTKVILDRVRGNCTLDGDISDQVQIAVQNIEGAKEGTYNITFQVINSMGDTRVLKTRVVVDNAGAKLPLVQLNRYCAYVSTGSSFDPASYISQVTAPDGSAVPANAVTIDSNVDTAVPGNYIVAYTYETPERSYTAYLAVIVE